MRLRKLLAGLIVLGILVGATVADAEPALGPAIGPHTVHPGHRVRFHADGFQPGTEVTVSIQPYACIGSNGCVAGPRRRWKTGATGSVHVGFRFPRRYGFCTAVGCTNYQPFRAGSSAQVQLCDVQYAEGEGQGEFRGCAEKMVRISGG
jgi:hypothetical protein